MRARLAGWARRGRALHAEVRRGVEERAGRAHARRVGDRVRGTLRADLVAGARARLALDARAAVLVPAVVAAPAAVVEEVRHAERGPDRVRGLRAGARRALRVLRRAGLAALAVEADLAPVVRAPLAAAAVVAEVVPCAVARRARRRDERREHKSHSEDLGGVHPLQRAARRLYTPGRRRPPRVRDERAALDAPHAPPRARAQKLGPRPVRAEHDDRRPVDALATPLPRGHVAVRDALDRRVELAQSAAPHPRRHE